MPVPSIGSANEEARLILRIRPEELEGDSNTGPRDAFSELITAERCGPPQSDFGGPSLERRSISEQVANRIMAMIKSGNLNSGDRLPTEAQMTIAFGISRPPLREALKALTIMGVLESRQGGRYTVTHLSPSRLIAPFNVMLSVADYNVNEHFEARDIVDVELVRLCTERANAEMRQGIHKLAVRWPRLLSRSRCLSPAGYRVPRGALCRRQQSAAERAGAGALRRGTSGPQSRQHCAGIIEKSVHQHIEVAEAVVVRDAAAATAAYRRHLEHVRDSTVQSMARFGRN
jgi:GntR family transcriptional regulator, L-lactate dehydrogenase operon regulator